MVKISLAVSSALLLHALSASASDANLLNHRAVSGPSSSSASVHSTPLPSPTRPTTTSTIPHATKASTSKINTSKACVPSIGTSKTSSSGVPIPKTTSSGISIPRTSSKPLIPTSITATGSSGIPSSSSIPIIIGSTVPSATESIAESTVTPTSFTLAPPAAPTSTAKTVVVTNPDDPSQSATFVKEDVPADLQSQLPSIPPGTLVPLIITISGIATPVVVSSAGTMVVPLGAVPAWLTPDLFPSPDSIPETDDTIQNESTISSSSGTPTGSAMTSIDLTITTSLTVLTADAIDGLTSFPPGTCKIPASAPTTSSGPPATNTLLLIPPSTTSSSPEPPAPPMPSETSGNNKGSALCPSLEGACTIAYQGYADDYLYTGYTSYVASMGDGDPINWLFAPFADNGCAAIFSCQDYSVGMTGAQIKQAVENMFVSDDVKECGSTYLSNGCQVTLNGCNDCQPAIPCGALPSGVTWDGCY